MDLNSRVHARVVANVDRQMYEWSETGSLYHAMPEAGENISQGFRVMERMRFVY